MTALHAPTLRRVIEMLEVEIAEATQDRESIWNASKGPFSPEEWASYRHVDGKQRSLCAFRARLAMDGFRNEQGYQSEEVLASSPEVQALSDAADAWEQTEGRDNGVHSGNGV